MTKGGKQPGAGRPRLPEEVRRKRRIKYLTDAENEQVQTLISRLRAEEPTASPDAAMLDLLEQIEWSGYGDTCPYCARYRNDGHFEDCDMLAQVTRLRSLKAVRLR